MGDILERRFRALDARLGALEVAGPSAAAPAGPAPLTAEEESARVAKIYEDLKASLKADLDAMVLAAKAELQAFVTSQAPAPAAPSPSGGRRSGNRGSPAPVEDAAPEASNA